MHWWGFVDGDRLLLTDLGFALLYLAIALLMGLLVYEVVKRVRVMRKARRRG
jgi:hypothetical protein